MTIDSNTPINRIIDAYPRMIDKILERNIRFEYMKYIALSCGTICERHTIGNVARMIKEDVNEFIAFLQEEIEKIKKRL